MEVCRLHLQPRVDAVDVQFDVTRIRMDAGDDVEEVADACAESEVTLERRSIVVNVLRRTFS